MPVLLPSGCSSWLLDSNARQNVQTEGCIPLRNYSKFKTSPNYPTTTLPTSPGGTPPRANWYAPPAKIGDNLYFVGTREHNSYALVSKDGEIILIDNLFGYATPDEILTGLQKVGLDPYKVRYLLIAHEHGDHDPRGHHRVW
jgi:metallo-beta-lactamase class B